MRNFLSTVRFPRCEFGDKISISRLCAYYCFDLDEAIETCTLSSAEKSFSEKIYLFRTKTPKFSEHNWKSDRRQAEKLAFLISDLFHFAGNPCEQLLLVSKLLKLSLKQIFQLCSPELFYRLLIIGGKLLNNGEDLSRVTSMIS